MAQCHFSANLALPLRGNGRRSVQRTFTAREVFLARQSPAKNRLQYARVKRATPRQSPAKNRLQYARVKRDNLRPRSGHITRRSAPVYVRTPDISPVRRTDFTRRSRISLDEGEFHVRGADISLAEVLLFTSAHRIFHPSEGRISPGEAGFHSPKANFT